MDVTNFCYWLQGFFEIGNSKTLTQKQVQIIDDHLKLSFINTDSISTKEIQLKEIEFCNWLNGFLDYSDTKILSSKKVKIIKDRLALVYNKVTPDRNNEKDILDNIKFGPKNTLDIDEDVLKSLQEGHDNINNRRYCHNGLGDLRVC